MKKVCIVSDRRSHGARDLTAKLVELGVEAVRAESKQPGYLNIGWGRPGDVNTRIPPNKLWELEACKKAGVRTVPFGSFTGIGANTTEAPAYIMGRNIRHTEGTDIALYQLRPGGYRLIQRGRKAQFEPDFYTAVIDKAAEYRAHVWFGKAVKYGKKTYRGEGESASIIWNFDSNWKLDYKADVPPAAWDLAKKAVKACGLDFGAVDVLEGKDGLMYFLEVNTRPGIEGQTILKYASKIKLLAEEA